MGGDGVSGRRLANRRGDGDVHGRGADRRRLPRGAAGATLPAHQPCYTPRHQV